MAVTVVVIDVADTLVGEATAYVRRETEAPAGAVTIDSLGELPRVLGGV